MLVAVRYITRPTIRGVRCVLFRGDEVLMVRHSYGDRRWSFPGGRRRGGEDPATTARREMREELALDIVDWRVCGEISFEGSDRATHVVACAITEVSGDVRPNGGEIEAHGWFPVAELPRPVLDFTDELLRHAVDCR